jgi:hypothetical protein
MNETKRPRKRPALDAVEQAMREQEVLRANRELAAYFRGRRTEREARGALKIIKAFIRDRERTKPDERRPLPGRHEAPKGTRVPRKAAARRRPVKPRSPAPPEPVLPPSESTE